LDTTVRCMIHPVASATRTKIILKSIGIANGVFFVRLIEAAALDKKFSRRIQIETLCRTAKTRQVADAFYCDQFRIETLLQQFSLGRKFDHSLNK
jgi:hypothetical protein